MNILLLGGTGAIGQCLVECLENAGHNVTITSRTQSGAVGRTCYVKGDARCNSFLESLFNNIQWHVIVDFMVYSTAEFKQRVDRLLCATEHYIFISSARVYSNSEYPLNEESPRLLDVSNDVDYLNTDEYALAKARQEDMLFNNAKNGWSIVRPYITFSKVRLQLGVFEKEQWLYRALRGRSIVFCDELLNRRTTLTCASDVANGIASLCGRRESHREVFQITGAETQQWSEILNCYLARIQRERTGQPKVVLTSVDKFLSLGVSRYQLIYDRLFDRVFDSRKIATFSSCINFKGQLQSLGESLDEFMGTGAFKSIDGRNEAILNKLTGENTSLGEIPGLRQKARYVFYRKIFGAEVRRQL